MPAPDEPLPEPADGGPAATRPVTPAPAVPDPTPTCVPPTASDPRPGGAWSGWAVRWWTSPTAPLPLPSAAGVVAVCVGAAAVLPRPSIGLAVPVLATACAWLVLTVSSRPRDRGALVMFALAWGLTTVSALRASVWLGVICLLAAICLAGAAALRARTWPGVLLAMPVIGVVWGLAIPWAAAGARRHDRPRAGGSWLRGGAIATVLAFVFAGLLSWADPVFGVVLGRVLPSVDLGLLPAQTVIAGVSACVLLGFMYASASLVDWGRLSPAARRRPAAEWALPLGVVDAVLTTFGIVQAAVLFGGYTPSLAAAGVTYADRAREGFGQLVVVTLLTIAVLGWAGRRADPEDAGQRRLLAITGGGLVMLALGVVASALRRMWLYEQAYGWTVLRLCVATFELWLAGVLLLLAAAWVLRRTAPLPRAVVASAAAVLLGLGLAGPDALVARWNVDRYERDEKVDTAYLSRLSADAWPALACLPPSVRAEVFAGHEPPSDAWYAANLTRWQAAAVLRDVRAGRDRC